MTIRTARQARYFRLQVQRNKEMNACLLHLRIRRAKANVDWLKAELAPERRLKMQYGLAYWESAVDSLETDGVFPERKGSE